MPDTEPYYFLDYLERSVIDKARGIEQIGLKLVEEEELGVQTESAVTNRQLMIRKFIRELSELMGDVNIIEQVSAMQDSSIPANCEYVARTAWSFLESLFNDPARIRTFAHAIGASSEIPNVEIPT